MQIRHIVFHLSAPFHFVYAGVGPALLHHGLGLATGRICIQGAPTKAGFLFGDQRIAHHRSSRKPELPRVSPMSTSCLPPSRPVRVPRTRAITGAGSGIGRACTLTFLRAGWSVVLVGRRLERLQAVIDEAGRPSLRPACASGRWRWRPT